MKYKAPTFFSLTHIGMSKRPLRVHVLTVTMRSLSWRLVSCGWDTRYFSYIVLAARPQHV